jgi:hemoglobin-like flavoprotein
MTPEQVDLVRTSFAKVAAAVGDPAALFYQRLFELDPRLRRLFRSDLTAQRGKLMAALRNVVGALDRLDQILPAVRELGRRHAHHGVETEHYATVGAALIWTLERGLGADFTPATRRAWVAAAPSRTSRGAATRRRPESVRLAATYFWIQVSILSAVHSSRPVKMTGSIFLPLIRSIITDGAR